MCDHSRTRRTVLGTLSLSAAAGVAGCQVDVSLGSTPTPESYAHLRHERVYVTRSLSLTIPDRIYPATAPAEADVVVLPARNDRSNGIVVEWLQAGKRVVFLGSAAQDAFHDLKDSRSYAAVYGEPRARATSCAGSASGGETPTECEPPELLVVWETLAGSVTSFGQTWGGTDDPTAVQVFDAIETSFDDE